MVDVGRAARLLDASRAVLRVATSDVRQLVAIRLSVHRVREALAVGSLVHLGSSATAGNGVETTDSSDSSNTALLNASSLAADHRHASVGDITSKANTRAAGTLVWRGVVDSVSRIGRVVAVQVAMLH